MLKEPLWRCNDIGTVAAIIFRESKL